MTGPWWVVVSLGLGAALGAGVNWAADELPPGSGVARPALWRAEAGALRLDRHSVVTLLCVAGTGVALKLLGASVEALWLVAWGAFFLLVAVVDFERRLVLNKVLVPGAAVAVGAGALGLAPAPSLVSGLVGGAAGFGLFLLVAVLGRRAMGAGDVKLAGVIGLVLGKPMVFSALFAGVVFGGVAAVVALLRGQGRKGTIAYAPWLCLGALVVLVQGMVGTP